VVLGSRLAVSCVLNHQSSSGSLTAENSAGRSSRLGLRFPWTTEL